MSKQDISRALLRCQACLRTSNEMMNCSGCHQARYCNSECQKKHWNAHKVICRANAATKAAIEEESKATKSNTTAGSQEQQLDIQRLAADLKSWTQAQRAMLTWVAIQALKLRTVPANASTHCIHVGLEYMPSAAEPSKRFKVAEVEKMSIADMLALADEKQMGDSVREVLKQSKSIPMVQAGALMPHVMLVSPPLMSLVPVGIEAVPEGVADDDDWEATFKRAVLTW